MTDRGYRSTKFVLLGGMLLYWIAGNMFFSEIHETDFHAAIAGAMVSLFASMLFLISFVCLITYHHIRILYKKIHDLEGEETPPNETK